MQKIESVFTFLINATSKNLKKNCRTSSVDSAISRNRPLTSNSASRFLHLRASPEKRLNSVLFRIQEMLQSKNIEGKGHESGIIYLLRVSSSGPNSFADSHSAIYRDCVPVARRGSRETKRTGEQRVQNRPERAKR